SVELQLGNSDKAAELYRSALTQGRTALGPNSIETARILNNLAYSKYKQGNLEEARTFYEWAIASTEGAVGDKDALLAACLRDYAQVLRSLGRIQDATAAESRAAKILAEAK
ncbi:MAG TPA: tetratricopeptide repeat protein, partial [Candidatus Melainabacteria bacterium]|nr:tetratricopeptide repeat protein [Candidatus Melainabacteria bacterium]